MFHSGPTVKLVESGGDYNTSSKGAYFVDSSARNQKEAQEVSQAGESEGCGVTRDVEKVDDRGVEDEARKYTE